MRKIAKKDPGNLCSDFCTCSEKRELLENGFRTIRFILFQKPKAVNPSRVIPLVRASVGAAPSAIAARSQRIC